jgi:peptidoglycan/xylan/chitin deacetylase (PgdA/CDA1 family)
MGFEPVRSHVAMSWRIFCYHGVSEGSASAFARQIDHLVTRGWRAVSLSEGLRSLCAPNKCFTVTFDDGQANVCEVAQRILDERGIPSVLYLATDYVLQGRCYRDIRPSRSCTWTQLGRWLEAGHDIGSHTHTHAPLPDLSPEQCVEELNISRDILRRELGHDPEHFAYPYGAHCRKTYECLRSLGGWKSAATVDRGWNDASTDPLCLRRDPMEPAWSILHCHCRLLLGNSPMVGSLLRRARAFFPPAEGWRGNRTPNQLTV